MKILVAEYAVATGADEPIWSEGCAMLSTLVDSFQSLEHDVVYPTGIRDLADALGELAPSCDAGLVIAPDDLLADYTEIIEKHTANLGCSPEAVELCADKLKCTLKLIENGVSAPRIISEENGTRYVLKPRFGCASEGVTVSDVFQNVDDFIVCEYVEGEHLSASIAVSDERVLPLTVNRQFIDVDEGGSVTYNGNEVPYHTPMWDAVMDAAINTANILGCRGYVGVDIVLGDRAWVVDVNPRPTTSIVAVNRIIDHEVGDLILKARFGELPEKVSISGSCSFTKDDLSTFHTVSLG